MSLTRVNLDREQRRDLNRTLKDFQIINQIGEGSFGTCYKVRDLKNSDILVMKKI